MLFAHNQVWMIGWEYPPHNSGGLGVACEGLTKSLADTNTQIYFTLPYTFPQNLSHLRVVECIDPSWTSDENLPPFLAYSTTKPSTLLKPEEFLDAQQLAALPQSDLEQKVSQYADVVQSQANKHHYNFDLIHAHDWMSFPAALKLKKKTGKPVIAHIHSTEVDRIPSGYGSPYIMHTEYEGMQLADRVIAVSHYTKHILVKHYHIDPRKIDVVHNGITPPSTRLDPGPHHFLPHRPVVVFMGRLTGQKGPEFFLKLAKSVLAQVPEALFILAGGGDMYHQLLFSTAGQGLSANVLYSGFLRDQQREKLLDRADVFVMPSISEPFGLVALEAAQRHTPVIVSKNSGVSEVLPSAIAIDFWDIEKMTSSIVELIKNPELKSELVAKQTAEVSKVTWDSASQKVKAIYQRAMRGQ